MTETLDASLVAAMVAINQAKCTQSDPAEQVYCLRRRFSPAALLGARSALAELVHDIEQGFTDPDLPALSDFDGIILAGAVSLLDRAMGDSS